MDTAANEVNAPKAKRAGKAPKAKAPRADGLGVFAAPAKDIEAIKADKPAKSKAPKAPKADKAKPAPKAKPAKPSVKPATPTSDADTNVESLLAEFHSSDVRHDDFMRSLFRKAFDAGFVAKRRAARGPRREGPTKRELAAELLMRPEGCTSREILDLTGWPAVSVPAVAKASGLTLRQEKDGRTTTYFGTPIKAN